jgi:hypothetical protein
MAKQPKGKTEHHSPVHEDPLAKLQREFFEMKAAWFTTLGVLILRSGGETVISQEEAAKAQLMEIRNLGQQADGGYKFTGAVKEPTATVSVPTTPNQPKKD